MAHRLEPPGGQPYWTPDEAIERLREEFAVVEVDREEGKDHVGQMIAKLIELKAPQAIIDQHVGAQQQAVRVVVSDDMSSDDFLTFVLMPDEGPFIGYSSAQHEESVAPLLARCATALSYQAVLI